MNSTYEFWEDTIQPLTLSLSSPLPSCVLSTYYVPDILLNAVNSKQEM